jgi:hypothetical protein
LRDRLGSGVVVLAGGNDGRVHLIAAVTKDPRAAPGCRGGRRQRSS